MQTTSQPSIVISSPAVTASKVNWRQVAWFLGAVIVLLILRDPVWRDGEPAGGS